jgi:hypothetical protein
MTGGTKLRAVVETVIVNGEEAPVTLTGEVEEVQLDCVGAPVHDTITEPVNPLNALTCKL